MKGKLNLHNVRFQHVAFDLCDEMQSVPCLPTLFPSNEVYHSEVILDIVHGVLRKQEVGDVELLSSCDLIQWVQINSAIRFAAASVSDLLEGMQFQISSCVSWPLPEITLFCSDSNSFMHYTLETYVVLYDPFTVDSSTEIHTVRGCWRWKV